MDTPSPLQQRFDQLAGEHYDDLKNAFTELYDQAHDKKYAYSYYKQHLFERNSALPHNSPTFRWLKESFEHHHRLDPFTAADETLKEITSIRQDAERMLEEAMIGKMPPLYTEIIETESCTYEEIIAKELAMRSFSEGDILHLLALHKASRILLNDLERLFPINQLDWQHKYRFTRSQQVLTAYYLLHMAGIDPRSNADISSCARLIHALLGIPYNAIKSSEIYKKLRNPLQTGRKTARRDLLLVRGLFEELDFQNILDTIDKDLDEAH